MTTKLPSDIVKLPEGRHHEATGKSTSGRHFGQIAPHGRSEPAQRPRQESRFTGAMALRNDR
jgi:hypothetical protein